MAEAMISVLTFNVRVAVPGDAPHHWEARRPLIDSFIDELAPDLVGLQEALHHQLDDLLADNPSYAAIGVGREDGTTKGEYSAVLYRRDRFVPLNSGTFWLSDTPENPGSRSWGNHYTRVCTWAHLRLEDSGETLYLFNTHLDHESQSAREKGAALILDRIAARPEPASPVILTGDFNAGEANPAVALLRSVLIDTFRVMHPDAVDVGTFHGFAGTCAPDRIDAIFVSPEFKVTAAAIHRLRPEGRYLSDHEPVSATITLPSPRD